MMQPKKNDIKTAKEYIRKRISTELRMNLFLDSKLIEAAKEIVSLAYKYNIPPTLFSFDYDTVLSHEVDSIINRLKDELYQEELLYATSTPRESSNVLIPYILRDINNSNFNDRLNLYTNRFKMELEDFIVGGLALGYSATKTIDLVMKSYKDPYVNPNMKERKRSGFSAYARLKLLTRHTIADAWMHADELWMQKNGAIGYMVYRGSSYPCSICDMMVGYHPINDYVLPVHPNCCCYAVPIFK